jgi:3-oxoacyl-[acyl-carrier-protein] synthase-3
MAFLEVNNVRIAGMSAGVPRRVIDNIRDFNNYSQEYTAEAFVESTGVKERRIDNLTTSDLCVPAAEQLITDLSWDKKEIDAVVFVSQTHDYLLPATACIIQDRLGLSKECYAMDVSLGCSGWVYGLSAVSSLLQNGCFKKALLLVGEAKRRVQYDGPLFGYAGTATALEYEDGAESIKFHFGTDGNGYDAIIIPDGGSRNQFTAKSLEMEDFEGHKINRLYSRMKGMDVFSFGISTVPKSVKQLSEHFEIDYQDVDYYVLHQANLKMNNIIVKKLKLDTEKVPVCMDTFGNTSSASIPLTIVTRLGDKNHGLRKYLCCGFGVGLSWGTVAFSTNNLLISKLVEVDVNQEEKWA